VRSCTELDAALRNAGQSNKRLLVWQETGDIGRMANRGRNLWIVVALALLGGFAWVVLRPHEPVFEGKPLSLVLAGATPPCRYASSSTRLNGVRGQTVEPGAG